MHCGPWMGCGAFSAADPGGYSQGSAGQPASQPPVRHFPMLPFRNSPHYSYSRLRVSGSQPLEDLSTPGQGQGEVPGDSESERSEDDDGDGRGRSERSERSSSRGWAPRHDDSQRKKKKSPAGIPGESGFRYGGGQAGISRKWQDHTPFRASASSGSLRGTPLSGYKRRSPWQTFVCQGLPKNGGDLLSQLVGQYHRRG